MDNPFDKSAQEPTTQETTTNPIDQPLQNDESSVFDVPDMLKTNQPPQEQVVVKQNPFEKVEGTQQPTTNEVQWGTNELNESNKITNPIAEEAANIANQPDLVQHQQQSYATEQTPSQQVQTSQEQYVIEQPPLQDQNIQNQPTPLEEIVPNNTIIQNGNNPQYLPDPVQQNQQVHQVNTSDPQSTIPSRLNNIINFYMFINPKLFTGEQIDNHEADLVDISFNVDFGNLRIVLYKATPATFARTSVDITAADKITTAHLYLEGRDQLIQLSNAGKGQMHNIERVFNFNNKNGNNWIPDKSTFTFETEDHLLLETTNLTSNFNFQYRFSGWQLHSLLKTCISLSNSDYFNSRVMRLTKP